MSTRVIVIGAGGAGLTAAITAAKLGAQVTLISKTSLGLGTCTAYSAGIFSLAAGGVSPQEHYQKTMATGKYVNDPALVRALAEQAEKSVLELAAWGIGIAFRGKGRASTRATAPNVLMGGAGFTAELARIARKVCVRVIEWSVVTKILTKQNRAVGVRSTNWRSGKSDVIAADAVILASGGGGQVFSRTDNPSRITGDGYALAKDLGLTLIDMEFVQFYPVGWADPALPAWMADAALVDYMRITDTQGREFFKEALAQWGYKNGAEANLYARDRCSTIMEQTARAGGAFAHLEDVTEDMWDDKGLRYALTIDTRYVRHLQRPVKVAPIEHYMCGGIKIDTGCRTEIEGLFACGEVTGGMDGANRIGGNALAGIITFGRIAGRNAARQPQTGDAAPDTADTPIPTNGTGTPAGFFRKELQQKAWQTIGPIRNATGLEEMLRFADAARGKRFAVRKPYDLLLALETPGLVETAAAVAKAALARKESLGTHYRQDGPTAE